MLGGLTRTQKIVGAVVAGLAIIGWATAIAFMVRSAGLQDEVAKATAEWAAQAGKISEIEGILERERAAAGSLAAVSKQVEAARTELVTVTTQLADDRREQVALAAQAQASAAELSKLTPRVAAAREELAALNPQLADARSRLSQLRNEIAQQQAAKAAAQPTISRSRPAERESGSKPVAGARPPNKQTAALPDPAKRFEFVDENGDGRIDRQEFNVRKVQLLDLVDANGDGYLTMDETAISEAAFKRFDGDGDGKVSQLEFIDARLFEAVDTDHDGLVTYEELGRILRSAAQ